MNQGPLGWWWLLGFLGFGFGFGVPSARAAPPGGVGRALIVIGLPGNREHEVQFAATLRTWRGWLTGPLSFAPAEVRVLGGPPGADGPDREPATREAIAREAAELRRVVAREDRLWVFWLGHASLDGMHASLHLPGPDLTDDQFGELFRGITAREQVFWMTSAGSGWLVRALSAPGRIVVAATERDQEFNETEFPEALANVARRPVARLDGNRDGKVSVLEVFEATVAEVAVRFASDQRVPTEHAQIDDNGDGVGTEREVPASVETGAAGPTGDGALAARAWVLGR